MPFDITDPAAAAVLTALAVLVFFAGACVFSFLGVIIYRLPLGISFVGGRSFCPGCRHPLGAADLVPVLGWLFLKGKCRYCGAKIPPSSPLFEAAGGTALIFCLLLTAPDDLSAFTAAAALRGILYFAVIGLCAAVAAVDMKTMEIPNGFCVALAVLGLLSAFLFPEISVLERLIGIVSASGVMLAVALFAGGAFGGGDIKLMAAAGLLLGWKLCLLALFAAIITGGGYAIIMLALKKFKKTDRFAFAPFLCAGIIVSMLAGETIINGYFTLLS